MEKHVIKFDEIKPIGNLAFLLDKITNDVDEVVSKCEQEKRYNKRIGKLIVRICGKNSFLESLENALDSGTIWDEREGVLCLLYSHLLVARLNDSVQIHVNKIGMDSIKKQLQDLIKKESDVEIYRYITII